ncbi:hypothetical protein K493DRAFT_304398 [Basidiobolus meristosporus CBS 931.73]|uniref:Frizzled/Smoothened 7TM domain-containing protein n=1 Tax=Basidiobolus meristosporus CBS 931.73 TaxID=1314790 RepID=A0A1Y1XZF7_9FUNG|nr:hypothetical protein K493DRAFT_304398 [Basidiobolus meristosporus CBS 931.73]|eukprot:ORX91045.1 hypothetical protein K493DRAFT_304398 [Basidiobolus meristosporus CBS 931.73]
MPVIYDASDNQVEIKRIITSIFSAISLLGGIFVVLTITYIRVYRPLLANRLSLKLTFWIALADIVYSVFVLILQRKITSNQLCALFLWGYLEFTLLPVFLTATIAFNLHAIFVSDIYDVVRYQKFYFPSALTLATSISLVPLAANQFEADPVVGTCWYSSTYTSRTMIWEICTLFGWVFIVVLYCIFAVCFIGYKLHKHEQNLRSNISVDMHFVNRKMNKAMRRIILYPVVLIVTQTFNCLCEFYTFIHGELYFSLYLLSAVLPACAGLLNAVVFIFDPAVRELLHSNRRESTTSGSGSDDRSFYLSRFKNEMGHKQPKSPSDLLRPMEDSDILIRISPPSPIPHSSNSKLKPTYQVHEVPPNHQVNSRDSTLSTDSSMATGPELHPFHSQPPKTKLMSLI